jgi:hypothetical protein
VAETVGVEITVAVAVGGASVGTVVGDGVSEALDTTVPPTTPATVGLPAGRPPPLMAAMTTMTARTITASKPAPKTAIISESFERSGRRSSTATTSGSGRVGGGATTGSGGAGGCQRSLTEAPHSPQKRIPGDNSAPHWAHLSPSPGGSSITSVISSGIKGMAVGASATAAASNASARARFSSPARLYLSRGSLARSTGEEAGVR